MNGTDAFTLVGAGLTATAGAWPLLAFFALCDESLAALVLALAILLWRRRQLDRLAAEIAEHRSTRIAALRRFALQGASLQAVYIVGTLAIVFAPDLFFDLGPFGARLCCWGATLLYAYALYDALTARLLYGAIQRRLRGSHAPSGPLLRYKWKTMLAQYLPALLLVEVLGALYLLGFPPYRLALVPLAALVVGLRGALAPHLQRWLLDARPLSETQWAELALRIAAWERRAQAPLAQPVYVTTIGGQGVGNVGVSGLWRPTLFIGASFLAHTEWRQRDAVICHELGHVRLRHVPLNILSAALEAALFVALLCAVDLRQLLAPFSNAPAPHLSLPNALLGGVLAFAWIGIYRFDRWRRRHSEFACDSFSALLTGDPLAMAVGLHTVVSLNGQQMMRAAGFADTHPRPLDRVNALMAELAAGSVHAPWAFAPVPAETQFRLAGRALTAPFDAATLPAPVPATPYPWIQHPVLAYQPSSTDVSRETSRPGAILPPLPLDTGFDASLRVSADIDDAPLWAE